MKRSFIPATVQDPLVITAVISDLHLGTGSMADLLRRPEPRRMLMAELEGVDHVVLLGDSIELREGPLASVAHAALPFFDELGDALDGGRVTLVAGNHDHQVAEPWLARHAALGRPLGLQHVSRPPPGDPLALLARRMPATELVLSYPGVWLRPDVYATHGHYLDCHNHIATFECMARALSERLTRTPAHGYRTPDDYEAVLAPVYRAIYRVAQSSRIRPVARAGRSLVRAWETAGGYRGARGRPRRTASRPPRRRPGLRAMAEVVERLSIDADYVLFGHLHRAGPLAADGEGWRLSGGTRLVNTGSWVYEPAYLGAAPAESPHRPGTLALVHPEGPPELRHVLDAGAVTLLGGRSP